MTLSYGFRIVGSTWERRRLVDAGAAFQGYAACDDRAEVHREAYLSAFHFGEDFRQLLQSTGSTAKFTGACWSAWIWFDIDRENNLDAALADARRLAAFIMARYRTLDDADLLLFYSGSKGFHIGIPSCLWGPAPAVEFHRIARRFAESIADRAGVVIDTGVYDRVRPFRAPNSRHPKTGRHKRRLTLDELMGLTIDRILQLAERPEPFEVPTPSGQDPQAVADWQAALTAVCQQAEAKAKRRAECNGSPTLNRMTLDFIRDGADQGDRHRLLFSAAANLAEYGCSSDLAYALLSEAALDSGLSPADVRRQIDCGLAHGKATESTPPAVAAEPPPPVADADQLRAELAALWHRQTDSGKGPPMADAHFQCAADVLAGWRDDVLTGKPPTFFPIGTGELSRIEIGPGLVTLIGGAPGSGKTAFTMQAVVDALRLTPTLRAVVCNVEMPPAVLLDRQLSRLSGIDLRTIRYRQLGADHADRIDQAMNTLEPLAERLAFCRPPFNLANVAATADAFDAGLLLLDYIQRIPPPGDHGDRRGAVDATMDYLRQFADAEVAVIVVSAVGRGKDSKGRSSYAGDALSLASFRESSELEFGADDAFILAPEGEDADTVTLRHLKARHTEAKDLPLHFERRLQRFTPVAAADPSPVHKRKMQSALRALWERTASAPETDQGDVE